MPSYHFYRIRFRKQGTEHTVRSSEPELADNEVVLVKKEERLEPAMIICRAAGQAEPGTERGFSFSITRRADPDEEERYIRLFGWEKEAAVFCEKRIKNLSLPMNLVRAERYFNGSKVIFYFTAESRVDFRELVKALVHEFRTRVEMRQIGVRHETQMTGGIGACGRELCCTSFLRKFESVSIKMAKTQDLPLNPAKISGVCNRLLCCLTYEYDNYKTIKQNMPRVGRQINYGGTIYRVTRNFALQGSILAISREGEEVTLTEKQWREAKPVARLPQEQRKKPKGKKGKKNTPQKNKKTEK
ncbi:MAG: hypothetical protein D3923_04530 [Candidatus Electrothrix sp. AR3]|nr:hypothetical protein [Candidatus Electrothrix sp. AR3]